MKNIFKNIPIKNVFDTIKKMSGQYEVRNASEVAKDCRNRAQKTLDKINAYEDALIARIVHAIAQTDDGIYKTSGSFSRQFIKKIEELGYSYEQYREFDEEYRIIHVFYIQSIHEVSEIID